MISRPRFVQSVSRALGRSPICALIGPRQCGKTTLAQLICEEDEQVHYFDLESPAAVTRLKSPLATLESLRGLIVIDEIQRQPELFPILRVLADRSPPPAVRFLILGSASPHLIRDTSETLAGRVEFVELGGFDLSEVGTERRNQLWLRGGLPRSFLAASDEDSHAWRRNFIQTFLERDIPQLGIGIPAPALRRFWTMLAHYHGQTWNASEIGRSMGLSYKTVSRYLDILVGTYMIRALQPWHANVRKRQVKSPKIYFRDSGLFHFLQGIHDHDSLLSHPKLGASWEGFMLEQVLRYVYPDDAYFWATHSGAELDLLLLHRGKRYGVECKWEDAPGFTKSMNSALQDLELERLWIVYPGKEPYDLCAKVHTIPSVRLDLMSWECWE